MKTFKGSAIREVKIETRQPVRAAKLPPVSVGVLLLALFCSPLQGKAEPLNLHTALTDTGLYFTAPLRWDAMDWAYFGGTVLAIGAAHHYDDQVRTHYVARAKANLDSSDPHSTRDAIPTFAVIGATGLFAWALNDSAGYEEAGSMLEAGALTAVSTLALKYAAGRQRPSETGDANAWFKSGDSFPSRHVSVAFAVGTVLAESGSDNYRWIRRILGYGIAGVTAYNRVHDNQHWLSDTVSGAALGLATAHFVMNRRNPEDGPSAFSIAPISDGVMLGYAKSFR